MQRRQAIAIPRHHVDDDLDVARVHVGQHVFRIALEHVGVEVERRLPRVPAARGEAGAEVDHRVERDPLLAERVDDAQHLRFVFERAMRLHVAERPSRRHRRASGDRREVVERVGGLGGVEDEDVVETRDVLIRRRQSLAGVLLLVPLVLRRRWPAAATGRNFRGSASLRSTCTHGVATNRPQPEVPNSTAAGLRDPYMSACHRGSIVSSAPRRSNCTGCSRQFVPCTGRGPPSPIPSTGPSPTSNDKGPSGSKRSVLDRAAGGVAHGDAKRRGPLDCARDWLDGDAEAPDGMLDSSRQRPQADGRPRPGSIRHGWRAREVPLECDRLERHAQAVRASRPDVQLGRLTCRLLGSALAACRADGQQCGGCEDGEEFHRERTYTHAAPLAIASAAWAVRGAEAGGVH